ncbi:MAG: hypothetical protein IT381_29510 [Deltaproteobacteria bacterium]|nr:hypothetical protein [Deltaproteobacteria bacterium]
MSPAPIVVTKSAPGKLFLFGEYAVLEGHLALVAAVDRRVVVRYATDPAADALTIGGSFFATPVRVLLGELDAGLAGPASRVVAGILAARDVGARIRGGTLDVDSRALFDGDRKLGFGSSAAVTVATFGALGGRVGDEAFARCRHWHNRAQGTQGSGGDIAASLLGGLACLRGDRIARIDWVPPLAVLFHPKSASTPAFVSNVKRFKQEQPAEYRARIAVLGAIAERAATAARAHDAAAWVALVREAAAALDALGEVSGTGIVTPYQREIATLCDSFGAASKPAGAGGGDVSLICAADDRVLADAMEAIRMKGGHCERLAIAATGLA